MFTNRILRLALISMVFLWLTSCGSQNGPSDQEAEESIFRALSVAESGIDFINTLTEDSIVNYFTYPYIYMGGGVAVGDVNNDGLQDLYFTGNQVEDRLYLNEGNLKFKDITHQSGVTSDNRWVTGVTMADVNHDGWIDIYVSVSGKWTTTKNLLYLNQGLDASGVPTFIEAAESAGIADEGRSTQATFFDYDKDGDLDLFVANYPYTSFKTQNPTYRFLMEKKEPGNSDKLYENLGDGTFEDATEKAGLLNFGLSLGVVVDDFNLDGWEDLYLSNDFASSDLFYFNNGDGTFTEKITETTAHTAYFGMGIDAGDLNNDGLPDLLQMDMTPEDNRRNKANMASMNPPAFYEMVSLGLHFQYMQNAVQLNRGVKPDGYPFYSDIARITGMSSTDWSWAGLIADLDNDGWRDVFITNGTRKDINNKDYFAPIEKASKEERAAFDHLEMSRNIPNERIDNYAFKNHGDLSFSPVIETWGLSFEGYSNGAAYADLDNDGDLEVIINNIDDPAMIYENTVANQDQKNYLRVQLVGPEKNPMGLGTKLHLDQGENTQYHFHTLTRGFQSSVDPVIHFGVKPNESIDNLRIIWPDGKEQNMANLTGGQLLVADYKDAGDPEEMVVEEVAPMFVDVSRDLGLEFVHQENPYNDFQYEVLLPHIYSRNGPGLAAGDVDGDGLDDFYTGGATGFSGVLFIQQNNGTFKAKTGPWTEDRFSEDLGAEMFDADGDGDLDLYVVSGGNEVQEGANILQDRLYLNQGQGEFNKAQHSLPEMLISGGRVRAGDYDADGDLDLFVGGRLVPRSYPKPANSYLLRNDGLKSGEPVFSDVTDEVAPDLRELGMVTDAAWVDFDTDGHLDLVAVGEWMPLTFFRNEQGSFQNKTKDYGLGKTTGWWYSLLSGDFDQDGDIDLVAGNLGLNYKYQATEEETFDVYAYDYDKNGKMDIVLGYYYDGVQYPLRGRQCSSEQIPAIKVKFEDYNSFAEATLEEVYSEGDLGSSLHYQAQTFASSYIENLGNGQFTVRKLPNQVQLSSINGIVSDDFNNDSHPDLLVAGNLYNAEVETTRNDAGYGYLLLGNGDGTFKPVPYKESGIYLPYDTKDLKLLKGASGPLVIAANNSDSLSVLKLNKTGRSTLAAMTGKSLNSKN